MPPPPKSEIRSMGIQRISGGSVLLNGTASASQFVGILHRVLMEIVSKLFRVLRIKPYLREMTKGVWNIDSSSHTQENSVEHNRFPFKFATKVFMLELGGFKLVARSRAFTVSDFHQMDEVFICIYVF